MWNSPANPTFAFADGTYSARALEDRLDERHEDVESVRGSANDYDSKRRGLHVLLEGKAAIESQENIADAAGTAHQLAVLDACPPKRVDVERRVGAKCLSEVEWELLVKQQTHQEPLLAARRQGQPRPVHASRREIAQETPR